MRLFICLLIVALPSSLSAAGDNWMSPFSDGLSLSQLSIPGTHDSGALFEPYPGTAKCQSLTISNQLQAGVRFLDIRCRHQTNAFFIYHGSVYQHLNFDDVLDAVIGFLNGHPAECVIMSVKQENTPAGNTRSFAATFDAYVAKNPGRWHLGSDIPTLGRCRGKIVLFRRFGADAHPAGIDASVWPDNTTFTTDGGLLRVQDWYRVTNNATKWNYLQAVLTEAKAGGAGTLYLNFSSGYQSGLFGIPDIPAVADNINPQMMAYFKANPAGRCGIIVMDFADAEKCAVIYHTVSAAAPPLPAGG